MDELVLYNPDVKSEVMSRAGELRSEGLDASEALSLAWDEVRNPKVRKAVKKVAEDVTGTSGLLLLAVGYAIWALVKKSWTPWKSVRLIATRPIAKAEIAVSRNNPGIANPGRDYSREVVNIIDPSIKRGL